MTDAFVMLFVKHCMARFYNVFEYAPAFPGHFGNREKKLLGLGTGRGRWRAEGKEELEMPMEWNLSSKSPSPKYTTLTQSLPALGSESPCLRGMFIVSN